MPRRDDTDVLVVGAGPVGLFAAHELVRGGIDVRILDQEWRTAAHSYALALHPHSLALLAEAGLLKEVIGRGRRIDVVAFYEGGDRKAELELAGLPADHPHLIAMPQDALEGALERSLLDRRVKVRWNHRLSRLSVTEAGATAVIERRGKVSGGYASAKTEWVVEKVETCSSAFVVGADGHRSTVRRELGIDYEPRGDTRVFAVFEFESDFGVIDEMRVFLAGETTNVLWPLPDGRFRFSFELPAPAAAAPEREKSRLRVEIGERSFHGLTREQLAELIEERAPWFDAEVRDLAWSLMVPFRPGLASRFGRDRGWLAGDSAHFLSPVGVQSMNVGLKEASSLARRIAAVLKRDGSPDLLAEYGAERTAEWRALLGIEGGFKTTRSMKVWVRRNRERILPCIPASGAELRHLAALLGLAVA